MADNEVTERALSQFTDPAIEKILADHRRELLDEKKLLVDFYASGLSQREYAALNNITNSKISRLAKKYDLPLSIINQHITNKIKNGRRSKALKLLCNNPDCIPCTAEKKRLSGLGVAESPTARTVSAA